MKDMKTSRLVTILMTLVSVVSCRHKELCYDHPHGGSLKVVFEWTKAAETVGQNMELFLFPSGGGHTLHYQFYSSDGGFISVPSGIYRAVCANTGTGANQFNDTLSSFDGFMITTRAVKMSESAILEPDILYSDHINEDIDIDDRPDQVLVMHPKQRTPRYTVILNNVRNLNGAKSCLASLSNLSCAYLAVNDEPFDDSHTETFEMLRTGETSLAGKVTIFGHRHTECHDHILTLYFDLQDGKKLTREVDVTARMDQLAREGSMTGEIIIDLDIEIPKPISNGSGFRPTVDGWEGEDIDVSI